MRRIIMYCMCGMAVWFFLGTADVYATAAATVDPNLTNDQNSSWKPRTDENNTGPDIEKEEAEQKRETGQKEETVTETGAETEENKQDAETGEQDTAADTSGQGVFHKGNGKKAPQTDPFSTSGSQMEPDSGTPGNQSGQPERFLTDTALKAGAGFLAGLLAAFVAAVIWKCCNRKRGNKRMQEYQTDKGSMEAADGPMGDKTAAECAKDSDTPKERLPLPNIGKVHHVGNRRNQQDTLGTMAAASGLLAVVSDGMGGLSDGEKVSRQVVKGMLEAVKHVSCQSGENPIFEMLCRTNQQVLKLLGPDRLYKSGATLVAALVNGSGFYWAAVGDSRIYFYCAGHLIQLNSEHIYKRQLFLEAVNQNISFSRASTDPQRERLTSFLGMGEMPQIDGCLHPVKARKGDKLLLMSDGIFNTMEETEMIQILESTKHAEEAAAMMEKKVLAAKNPKQDNFTCIILDF